MLRIRNRGEGKAVDPRGVAGRNLDNARLDGTPYRVCTVSDSNPPNLEPAPASAAPVPCPYLPAPRAGLDWRALHAYRSTDRGAAFYFSCLEYGHALWLRGLAARALLCLDRAFGAELGGGEPVLRDWPLPYAATAWVIAHTPPTVFIGNPRVHFQHYADRMNEPRRDQRQARAWACWAIARQVRPDLPGDPKHRVHEPTDAEIAAALQRYGHPGEEAGWRGVMAQLRTSPI
jgi:hypothetical protein